MTPPVHVRRPGDEPGGALGQLARFKRYPGDELGELDVDWCTGLLGRVVDDPPPAAQNDERYG